MKSNQIRVYILIFLFLILKNLASAQNPTFLTNNAVSTGTSIPFGVTNGSASQSLIAPYEYNGLMGSAYLGYITNFYVQGNSNSTASFSNMVIKMGQTKDTTLPIGALYTGNLTTVYNVATVNITSNSTGWIKIVLQTPFLYDPQQSLVVEISQCTVSGTPFNAFNVSKIGSTRRTWNLTGCVMSYSGQDGNLLNCGIDLVSAGNNDIGIVSINQPSQFCSPGSKAVVATLKNFGNNQITNSIINWSVNGVLQTPYTFTGVLDTFGGAGSTTATIPLGSYIFPSSNTLIKVWSSLPNTIIDTIPFNDTSQTNIAPLMSGAFTINPAGTGINNFTSFNAAIGALTLKGICGPIHFTVAPGTYNTQVIIPNIVGATSVNTITFDGVNPNLCIISGNYFNQGAVIFNEAKYITFKNFTVINNSYENPSGIAAVGRYNRITLYNNRVFVPIETGTSTQGYGIIATGTIVGNGSAHTGDSLLIDSNEVTGGAFGILILGSGSYAVNRGIQVLNNRILSANYTGLSLDNIYNPINVINNNIHVLGKNYGYYALWFNLNSHNNTSVGHKIIGNQIRGWSYIGMYINNHGFNSMSAPTRVYNNVIEGIVSGYSLNQHGIFITSPGNTTAEIYHNTIVLNSSTTSPIASCLYTNGTSNFFIKNNIFFYKGGAGTALFCFYSITGNKINYNIYYNEANPNTGGLVRNGGATWNSTNFKTASRGGDSSYATNPSFLNRLPEPGNLSLVNGCDGFGVDLNSNVPLDINGNPRKLRPNIGAYEFNSMVANDLSVVSLLSPSFPLTFGAKDLRFLVKNIGNNPILSYTASYKKDTSSAISMPITASIGVCATDTASFIGLNQISIDSVNHLSLYTHSPNASVDSDRSNDTLSVSIFTPLSGTYTVGGASPDFPNVAAAAASLKFGVSGPVTFDIRPGTYIGQVEVNGPIIGASNLNRIVFEGNSNLNRIIQNSYEGPVFLINQANFITVQNIKIINTSSSGQFSGIGVVGTNINSNASNIQILKNIVEVPILSGTSTNGFGIIFTGTIGATNISAMRGDSNIIDSNIITGGGYGIVNLGAANSLYNRGLLFRGNHIIKANYIGVNIANNYNPIDFLGNHISVQGDNFGYYGVNFEANASTHPTIPTRFNGNIVTGFSYIGARLSVPVSGATAAPLQFYNNMFNSIQFGYALTQFGVQVVLGSNASARIYHNTSVVNSGNNVTPNSAFYVSGSANVEVKNNIFAYYYGSGVPFYTATALTGNKLNYNNYYNGANPTGGNLLFNGGNWNVNNYQTNTRGGDSSFNYAPIFVSRLPMPGNLRLTNACEQRGVNLTTQVLYDIDNQFRGTMPQIGADENASAGVDMAMESIHSPVLPIDSGWQNVAVRVRNNGSSIITSFVVSYSLNNGIPVSQSWTGSLSPCDTALITFTGAQQLYVAYNSVNRLKLYTSNPNTSADGNNFNDTVFVDAVTSLGGNYIIGPGLADFPSFNAAVNALNLRGVNAPVTFMVKTGTYNESVFLNRIVGASTTNSITFKSMANNRDSVILAHNSASGNNFVVAFGNNANYIVFKDITIRQLYDAGFESSYIVKYIGNASYDSLINCVVIQSYVNDGVSGFSYSVYGTNLTGVGNGFKNNLFRGTSYGIYWWGNNTPNQVSHTTFEGNTFDSAFKSPLSSIRHSNFTTITNNNVLHDTRGYFSFFYLDSTTIFTGNKFTTGSHSNIFQFQRLNHNGFSPRSIFANNTFVGPDFQHHFGDIVQNLDFFNNTYSIGSQSFNVNNMGLSNVKFRNNIFMSSTANAISWSSPPISPDVSSDYNNFWSTISTNPIWSTSSMNLNAFRLANPNQEKNSVQADPGFTSFLNVIPDPTHANVWNTNGRGEIQTSVPTDINNVARAATVAAGVPDLGAYEVTPLSIPNNCIFIPTTPVAGGTQVVLSGLDTVMTIKWNALSAVPSSISAKLYTGIKAPLLGTATGYSNFYVEVNAPNGSYNYLAKLYYNPSWIGTIQSEAMLKMSIKAPTSGWLNLLGASSTVNSNLKLVTANSALNNLPAIFTFTDQNNPLPIELILFTGTKENQSALLNWATATEKNSSHFVIEKSLDAKSFMPIDIVKSHENSSNLKYYIFKDLDAFENSETIVYYRLKLVDRDGLFDYSNIISIENKNEETSLVEVKVFPNPFNHNLHIDYKAESNDETVDLRDMSGRLILTQSLSSDASIHQLNINNNLEIGVYFLTFSNKNIKSVKLIKNN